MLIAARNAMMAGGGWKNPYVTDGLIAMWDGEWNAGGGKHDPNATTWVDLVGGYVATCGTVPPVWGANYTEVATDTTITGGTYTKGVWVSNATFTDLYPLLSAGGYTMEFVGYTTTDRQYLNVPFCSFGNTSISGTWYGGSIAYYYNTGGSAYPCWNGKYTATTTAGTQADIRSGTSTDIANKVFQYVAAVDFDNNETRCYRDGRFVGQYEFAQISGNAFGRWFYSPLQGLYPKNRAYRSSLYSRALTADEIAANYAVDKARFNLP